MTTFLPENNYRYYCLYSYLNLAKTAVCYRLVEIAIPCPMEELLRERSSQDLSSLFYKGTDPENALTFLEQRSIRLVYYSAFEDGFFFFKKRTEEIMGGKVSF